jgi:hypothetical protein
LAFTRPAALTAGDLIVEIRAHHALKRAPGAAPDETPADRPTRASRRGPAYNAKAASFAAQSRACSQKPRANSSGEYAPGNGLWKRERIRDGGTREGVGPPSLR